RLFLEVCFKLLDCLRDSRRHRALIGFREDRRDAFAYDTLLVFLRMKSIRINCPSVIVFVKYALPRQIAETVFTNSTRLRSRPSMNVLINTPLRRHSATSRYVSFRICGSTPIEFT